jgi:hypothetical protein
VLNGAVTRQAAREGSRFRTLMAAQLAAAAGGGAEAPVKAVAEPSPAQAE